MFDFVTQIRDKFCSLRAKIIKSLWTDGFR